MVQLRSHVALATLLIALASHGVYSHTREVGLPKEATGLWEGKIKLEQSGVEVTYLLQGAAATDGSELFVVTDTSQRPQRLTTWVGTLQDGFAMDEDECNADGLTAVEQELCEDGELAVNGHAAQYIAVKEYEVRGLTDELVTVTYCEKGRVGKKEWKFYGGFGSDLMDCPRKADDADYVGKLKRIKLHGESGVASTDVADEDVALEENAATNNEVATEADAPREEEPLRGKKSAKDARRAFVTKLQGSGWF